jgi:hypothetical protein
MTMSTLAAAGKVGSAIAESLKSQPLAPALVVINLAFLIGFAFMFGEIAASVQRKDALVVDLVKNCVRRSE